MLIFQYNPIRNSSCGTEKIGIPAAVNVEDGKIPWYSKEVNLQDGTGFRTL
jgi:hypothetical protein